MPQQLVPAEYMYHFNGNDLARAVVSKAPKKNQLGGAPTRVRLAKQQCLPSIKESFNQIVRWNRTKRFGGKHRFFF